MITDERTRTVLDKRYQLWLFSVENDQLWECVIVILIVTPRKLLMDHTYQGRLSIRTGVSAGGDPPMPALARPMVDWRDEMFLLNLFVSYYLIYICQKTNPTFYSIKKRKKSFAAKKFELGSRLSIQTGVSAGGPRPPGRRPARARPSPP